MVANLLRKIGIGVAVFGCVAALFFWTLATFPIWLLLAIVLVSALTGFNIANIPNLPDGWFQQTIRTDKNVPKPGSRYGVRIPEAQEEKIDPVRLKSELDKMRDRIGVDTH